MLVPWGDGDIYAEIVKLKDDDLEVRHSAVINLAKIATPASHDIVISALRAFRLGRFHSQLTTEDRRAAHDFLTGTFGQELPWDCKALGHEWGTIQWPPNYSSEPSPFEARCV